MSKIKSLESYKEDVKQIWGDLYDYDYANYSKTSSIIKIYCHEHDFWFEKKAGVHIYQKQGCPKCGKESSIKKHTKSNDTFIQEIINK